MYEEAEKLGRFPTEIDQATIVVLPKTQPPSWHCSAYRPILLLNIEIKVFSSILASRLKEVALCRFRTHQWCFIIFNIILFHALLFGADFIEEYFMQSLPVTYSDASVLELREKARKLDLVPMKDNISRSYVISDSEACSHKDILLLLIISSSPENKTKRDLIRQTWANVTQVKGYTVLTLFALGKPKSETVQLEIIKESEEHGDIIQGSFEDSIQYQTLKLIMSMQWMVTFCPNTRFLLKVEEDMFVNLMSIVDYLIHLRTHPEDIYIGRVIHQETPVRSPERPDFVPFSLFPEKYYPDYCSGAAFIISQDVARKVYVASEDVPTQVPPDVFVGMCAKRVGIVPIHSSRFSGRKHIQYNRCCYRFIFTSANTKEERPAAEWRDLDKGNDCSLLETYYGLVSCKVWTYLDKIKHLNLDNIRKDLSSFTK
ncbi:beta-1,3-galactosyltransferase 9 [Pleurodeles waltl]|uniref:beta-1,3-galactosyltransferase 9 n=1 Tax=Pleurodeles waltl TaxID=8319 RepID=UPI003709C079